MSPSPSPRRRKKSVLKRRAVPLLLSLILTLTFSPAACAYSDTGATWAREVIEKAGEYGLMEGYPDGRFGVGENMTRAQFATVLCRLFGWEPEAAPDETLSDVNTHWAKSSIYAAARHGAFDCAGAFRPDDYITRSEMAVMLVRSLGYGDLAAELEDVDLPFPDVTENRGAIAMAYDFGIINGVPSGNELRFLPDDSAPREQCAAMLVRCYERLHLKTDWLHGFYAVSSYSQIGCTDEMDAVSMGWGRVEFTPGSDVALDLSETEPALPAVTVNQTAAGGNDWLRPQGAEEVLARLETGGKVYNLCIYSSAPNLAGVFDAGLRDELISQLVEATGPYTGLTVDFEGLGSKRREEFSAFLTALRAALPADKLLYAAVPADKYYGGYDYRAIGEVCDKVILMAHSYQWTSVPEYYVGTTNTYSPLTPIDEIYVALRHVADPATGVQDKSKVALAISFGTVGLHVDETGALLDTSISHPGHATVSQRLTQPDSVRVWDEQSRNPCLHYTTEEGERYVLWYEDAQSVTEKLDLARLFGITGVSIWRLGSIPIYDDVPNYDLWDVFLNH